MKKYTILGLVAVILTFSSCDEFFTTSWGKSRTYDPSKIDVNADNIDKWVKAATGNPDLADAVTSAIIHELEKFDHESLGSPEAAALLDGGVKLAVEASGVSTSIVARGAELLGDIDHFGEDTVMDLLGKIQGDFNSGGGPAAAKNIATMVELTIDKDGPYPKFVGPYANIVKPGDVAEAILVLVLGEYGGIPIIEKNNWEEITSKFEGLGILEDTPPNPPHINITNDPNPPTSGAIALAAYLNLIADDKSGKFTNNPLTDTIREAFFDNWVSP